MQRDRIEHMRPASHRGFVKRRRGGDRAGAALQRRDIVVDAAVRRAQRTRLAAVDREGEFVAQCVEPALAHRDGRHDRHAQLARQHRRIERQPVALGEIDHVERDHHR